MENKFISIKQKKLRPGEAVVYALIFALSAAVIAMVVYFVAYVLAKGLPHITWQLLSTASDAIKHTEGIFPSIINTLYIVLTSLVISVPLGMVIALYMNEFAKHQRVIQIIEFLIESLSGIPSILFGVIGYSVFCLFFNLKVSLISGALTLSVMVLPIMIRTAQEALRTVPDSYRQGALGLGATKFRLIRTILIPCSLKGIITGIILSVGRIISESAALLLVAGGQSKRMPNLNPLEQMVTSGSTLSVEVYRYHTSRGDDTTAFAIAAVLMIIVIALNLFTRFVASKLNKGHKK